jgi:hypothetical protein
VVVTVIRLRGVRRRIQAAVVETRAAIDDCAALRVFVGLEVTDFNGLFSGHLLFFSMDLLLVFGLFFLIGLQKKPHCAEAVRLSFAISSCYGPAWFCSPPCGACHPWHLCSASGHGLLRFSY